MRDKVVIGLVAVGLVAALVGGILYNTRNRALALKGQVLKVRSHTIAPDSTLAVLDLRISNTSRTQFVVRNVAVKLENSAGKMVDGEVFPDVEAANMLRYYPIIGPKYNQTLIIRDKIEPGRSIDRMLAVRFPISDEVLVARKAFRILVTDLDRVSLELIENNTSPK